MRFHSLAEWLAWQEHLHPAEIELGLDRVKTVARQLPFFTTHSKIKTIIVGGTNGKGSCVAFLEAILLAAGYRVGSYSSPHLISYNERVRINARAVSDVLLCESFERVDQARNTTDSTQVSLTYFEFGTLAALDIFYREKVNIRILEVGLGGRLDAVNIMEPDAVVITNVALDHEAWLGDNRESIGKEKAGIFRAGIPLVIGEPEPPASIRDASLRLDNPRLRLAGKDFVLVEHAASLDFQGLGPDGAGITWCGLHKPVLPLPSAACALQVVVELGLANRDAVETGLQQAHLSGRLQQLSYKDRSIILDVAHNPAGAAFLAEWLRNQHKNHLRVVFSALADKDCAGLVAELAPFAGSWYLAPLNTHRAAPLGKLMESVARVRVPAQGFDTIGAAFQAAVAEAGQGDTVLVCGSFYTVAEALSSMAGSTQKV